MLSIICAYASIVNTLNCWHGRKNWHRPLESAIDCRRKLARVYQQARRGEITTQDMGRFANLLQIMVGMISDTDIEVRIAELEQQAGG